MKPNGRNDFDLYEMPLMKKKIIIIVLKKERKTKRLGSYSRPRRHAGRADIGLGEEKKKTLEQHITITHTSMVHGAECSTYTIIIFIMITRGFDACAWWRRSSSIVAMQDEKKTVVYTKNGCKKR